MRKLAYVVKIDDIREIPNADRLCIYVVGGWNIVDTKEKYSIGDLAVMIETDSWIPHDIAPFLSKGKEPREYNGVKGERLKTAKLRGVVSQGLLLPMSVFDTIEHGFLIFGKSNPEGIDVSDILNIQKWEAPIPAQLAGVMRGNFPSAIPKTDQPRIQNLKKELSIARHKQLQFTIEEKLEGSSLTMYLDDQDEFHVCSRNLDLTRDDTNTFWRAALKYDVENIMRQNALQGYAIQSEMLAPGVQGNIYKLTDVEFYVFDVYDVKQARYLYPTERRELINKLGFKQAPVLCESTLLGSMEDIISLADGTSMLYNTLREGIVFKQIDGDMTFKSISQQYLIKTGN